MMDLSSLPRAGGSPDNPHWEYLQIAPNHMNELVSLGINNPSSSSQSSQSTPFSVHGQTRVHPVSGRREPRPLLQPARSPASGPACDGWLRVPSSVPARHMLACCMRKENVSRRHGQRGRRSQSRKDDGRWQSLSQRAISVRPNLPKLGGMGWGRLTILFLFCDLSCRRAGRRSWTISTWMDIQSKLDLTRI